MKVEQIKPDKLHMYTIEFDDGTNGQIDKTVWEHGGYTVGTVFDDAAWEQLLAFSQTHRAKEKALYYLSLRDYGSGELVLKLQRAGIARDWARTTVEQLVASGLIDDYRYAAALARDMTTRKLYPKRRVSMALRDKGFSAEVIDFAVSQLPCEEEQQALELLHKKRYNNGCDCQKREKAFAMLARHGFSYAVSKRALALLDEE